MNHELDNLDFSPASADSNFFGDDSLIEQGLDEPEEKPRKGSRKGSGNAEKRSQHNAIERARRESLNGRFIILSEALPMTSAERKRPSKSMIVNKALDFVHNSAAKEFALMKENKELRSQVQELRAQLGLSPLPPPVPLPAFVAHHSKSTTKRAKTTTQQVSNYNLVRGSGFGEEYLGVSDAGSPPLNGRKESIQNSLPSPAASILQSPPIPITANYLNDCGRFPDVVNSPAVLERNLINFNFEGYQLSRDSHDPYSLQQSSQAQYQFTPLPIQQQSHFYMQPTPNHQNYYQPRSQSLPEALEGYSVNGGDDLWSAMVAGC